MAKAVFTAQDVPNQMVAAINRAHADNFARYIKQQQQPKKVAR